MLNHMVIYSCLKTIPLAQSSKVIVTYSNREESSLIPTGCDDLLIKSTLLLDFLKTIDIVRVIL